MDGHVFGTSEWGEWGIVLVTLILKHFLVCVVGQLLLREMFLSHSLWLREKCCCDDFLFGVQ